MTTASEVMPPRIGIYCDLGKASGAGHFVRCTALGAALVARGTDVAIAADSESVPWTKQLAASYGINAVQCDDVSKLTRIAQRRSWVAVVVDSYTIQAADLSPLKVPIVVIDDQATRPLPAQLIVNQNLSAPGYDYSAWENATALLGPAYALVRPELLTGRSVTYRQRSWDGRAQRVLVICGGTDSAGAATLLTQRTLDTVIPVNIRVIASPDNVQSVLDELAIPTDSTVTPIPQTPAVAELMNWADLVITTAGSTVWELCCLGVPMALVVVADNQHEHYQAAVQTGVAIGLGTINEVASADSLPHRRELATSAALNAYGERAWQTVDGLGAARVASAILELL